MFCPETPNATAKDPHGTLKQRTLEVGRQAVGRSACLIRSRQIVRSSITIMNTTTLKPFELTFWSAKRPQVRKACFHCRKAHAACANELPCTRCLSKGLECSLSSPGPRSATKRKEREFSACAEAPAFVKQKLDVSGPPLEPLFASANLSTAIEAAALPAWDDSVPCDPQLLALLTDAYDNALLPSLSEDALAPVAGLEASVPVAGMDTPAPEHPSSSLDSAYVPSFWHSVNTSELELSSHAHAHTADPLAPLREKSAVSSFLPSTPLCPVSSLLYPEISRAQ